MIKGASIFAGGVVVGFVVGSYFGGKAVLINLYRESQEKEPMA